LAHHRQRGLLETARATPVRGDLLRPNAAPREALICRGSPPPGSFASIPLLDQKSSVSPRDQRHGAHPLKHGEVARFVWLEVQALAGRSGDIATSLPSCWRSLLRMARIVVAPTSRMSAIGRKQTIRESAVRLIPRQNRRWMRAPDFQLPSKVCDSPQNLVHRQVASR
jgi:hypothetical protein